MLSWFEAQGVSAGAPLIPPTHVAASVVPFHRIDMPLVKLVPVRVNVKAGDPAMADCGFKLRRVGAANTVNVAPGDRLPPGFTATIVTGPGVAIMAGVIWAVRLPAFTKVVTN